MKKCPYCAEEIQDEAVVCRYCGRELKESPPMPTPSTATYTTKPKSKPIKTSWVLFVIFGSVFICVGCGLLSLLASNTGEPKLNEGKAVTNERADSGSLSINVPTNTPKPSPTHIPTITPSPITMQEIELNRANLTELQWEEYEKSLPGTRIHWTGTVDQVSDAETIYLDVGEEVFHSVYLEGVSVDVLKTLTKGQTIEFEATIRRVSTFLGLSVFLDDPPIIEIR